MPPSYHNIILLLLILYCPSSSLYLYLCGANFVLFSVEYKLYFNLDVMFCFYVGKMLISKKKKKLINIKKRSGVKVKYFLHRNLQISAQPGLYVYNSIRSYLTNTVSEICYHPFSNTLRPPNSSHHKRNR